ncbi:SLC13 family permease [Acinetobacter sp. WZC-1]|uniref:SLC13 family permease n=1 Tax=Acinetobacter sp. WZC-1 TaxID=3459034 RepID=UPI00403E340F
MNTASPVETPAHIMPRGLLKGWIIILVAAVLSFGLFQILPYDENARKGISLLFFIATLWLTEAIHVTVAALLVPVLAVLIGIPAETDGKLVPISTVKALSDFANPIIFLLFGSFALTTALRVQKLDRKIAMWIITISRGHLGAAVLMMFAATAVLSMWISNVTTVTMMLPLALGLLSHMDTVRERKTFVFILLGIAYSASIGGLGTLVGSPPNVITAKAIGYDFSDWMKVGLPMMLLLFPAMLASLYLVLRPALNQKITFQTENIRWTGMRITAMLLFVGTALAWVCSKNISDHLGISQPDTWIAMVTACLVVITGTASWKDVANNTDWGVLLLVAGGLTLSGILKDSGTSLVLGQALAGAFGHASAFLILVLVATFLIILTEFTSNTATAALMVPVFAAIAGQVGVPKEMLVLVVGIGASCAFMLPVATGPNAVVFGTGHIRQSEMMRVGLVLNIMCIVLVPAFIYWYFH